MVGAFERLFGLGLHVVRLDARLNDNRDDALHRVQPMNTELGSCSGCPVAARSVARRALSLHGHNRLDAHYDLGGLEL